MSAEKQETGFRGVTSIEGVNENGNFVRYSKKNMKGVYCISPEPSAVEYDKKYKWKIGMSDSENIYSRLYSYGTFFPDGWWNSYFILTDQKGVAPIVEKHIHKKLSGNEYVTEWNARLRHEWFVVSLKRLRVVFLEAFEYFKKNYPEFNVKFVESTTWSHEIADVRARIEKTKKQFL